jgi:hypothetical protein
MDQLFRKYPWLHEVPKVARATESKEEDFEWKHLFMQVGSCDMESIDHDTITVHFVDKHGAIIGSFPEEGPCSFARRITEFIIPKESVTLKQVVKALPHGVTANVHYVVRVSERRFLKEVEVRIYALPPNETLDTLLEVVEPVKKAKQPQLVPPRKSY